MGSSARDNRRPKGQENFLTTMRCLNCSREGLTTETQVCPGCGVYLPSLVRELLPPGTLLHGGK